MLRWPAATFDFEFLPDTRIGTNFCDLRRDPLGLGKKRYFDHSGRSYEKGRLQSAGEGRVLLIKAESPYCERQYMLQISSMFQS